MDYNRIKLGIIGAGRWGINHIRTAASLLPKENIFVLDSDTKSEEKVKKISDKINFSADVENEIKTDKFNLVIISTPAVTHYSLALKCLNAGKHVLVEKPIALEVNEAEELVNIADKQMLKLMVGHVLLYHPAVLKMKEEIDVGRIGHLQYIYSNRLNLGAIRNEENILWSFAPHDISVIQFLTGSNPVSVKAHGATFVQNGIEDTTLTYLEYPDNVKAHIFVSWLNPFKEQRMVVIGDKGMIVFEDTLPNEKLKFFEKGFKVTDGQIEKFDHEYEVLEFESRMPLAEEHIHFYSSVINNTKPLTDGKHALEVLRILQSATDAISS